MDTRSDIFSFGALLYEMLTARRAFEGNSQASIIAAILERDPPPVTVAAPITPPALDRVVRKCLSKDPDRRWQSAADLCDELSWIAQARDVRPPPRLPSASRRTPLALVAAALTLLTAGMALGWWLAPRGERSARAPRHLAIAIPDTLRLEAGGMAVSPDGRSIVFVASDVAPAGMPPAAGGPRRLYLRRLDSSEPAAIPGTEGARAPFFSPDGESVGYFTSSALMKVSLQGGAPTRLTGTPPVTRGGAWLPDDSIVVAPTQSSPLGRLMPGATTLQPLTTLDESAGEQGHAWPQLLPGGEDVLFTVRRGTAADVEASDVALVRVATGERRVLLRGGAFARYSPSGHLVFLKGGALSAVPFHLDSRQVTGPAVVVADGVAVEPWAGGAITPLPRMGRCCTFAAASRSRRGRSSWWTATARQSRAVLTGNRPSQPRISPDGTRAVFTGLSADGDNEIYLGDLTRGTSVRFSGDPQDDFTPAWTHDGGAVFWTALPRADRHSSSCGQPTALEKSSRCCRRPTTRCFAGSVSPSGVLAYTVASSSGGRTSDIWVVPLTEPQRPRAFVATSAKEFGPEFSPDGKWIAYVSGESGTEEIYVVPYPGPGAKRQITNSGGVSPVWRRDGRELFYQTPAGLMAVEVSPGVQIQFGPPRLLFAGNFLLDSREDGPRAYDVAPDGKRFLMIHVDSAPRPGPALQVLIDWSAR